MPEIVHEVQGPRSALGHAVFHDEIREIGVPQQLGLFAAQREDADDGVPVVELASARARAVGAVQRLARLGVVQIRHDRQVARRLERETPALQALVPGVLPGGCDRAVRQARQFGLVAHDVLERVGRVEHVLGELRSEPREFDIDLQQARLAGLVEFGPAPAEVGHGLVQEPPLRGTEPVRLR